MLCVFNKTEAKLINMDAVFELTITQPNVSK